MIIPREATFYGALATGLHASEFVIGIISFVPVNKLTWSPFTMKKLRQRETQLPEQQRTTQESSRTCAAQPSTTLLTLCLSVSCEIDNNSEKSKKETAADVC